MSSYDAGGWKREYSELARAFSGAFLFGITLLYTMELWWIGTYISFWRLFLLLAFAFAANLALKPIGESLIIFFLSFKLSFNHV